MIDAICKWLKEYHYYKSTLDNKSLVFVKTDEARIIIIDTDICNQDCDYTEYTTNQNQLMHTFDSLYRFIIENEKDLIQAKDELKTILEIEQDYDIQQVLPSMSIDRANVFPDPTPTEKRFEDAFLDTYGRDSYDKILREASFYDIYGTERFYDYLLEISDPHYFIAIEQNGETYHNPWIIKKEKYKSQLIKQNSFIANGNKLFRWSIGGMIQPDNFIEDIRQYLGSGANFLTLNYVKANRDFQLYEHQEKALSEIHKNRKWGETSSLIVLPTGTGKTQILIEDLRNMYTQDREMKSLIMVPTRNLCAQISKKIADAALPIDLIDIHTYSWIGLHHHNFEKSHYSYIAVDEAHHALAPTIKRSIQYFTPRYLIGMTATDKRLDDKKLEDVFGRYETNMSLKEAVLKGVLTPIHAFRVKSNLDLSEIRFNGKDYVSTDLEKSIIIDSRDELIAGILKKYFCNDNFSKQGVIFCVNVNHAKRMATCLKSYGIIAKAVAGKITKSNEYLKAYEDGHIQFLTCCSLISEGWDSPRTSVIVMARPTMSKVLYTQQIGRGTRRCKGKDALYIIDIVDNYGAYTSPWSIHAMTQSKFYKPWANIFSQNHTTPEELVLSGLYQSVRKLEEIDIFTFEEKYGSFLSSEQLARELFVSTGTINNWIRKEAIKPDVNVPFGKRVIPYFHPSQVEEIRKLKGLKEHDISTIYKDFNDFLDQGDYTFSYKIVFLLAFLTLVDSKGFCQLDKLMELYIDFYRDRIERNLAVDRKGCPYSLVYLQDRAKVRRSILSNPFEKFERKRFMFHTKPEKSDLQQHPELKDFNIISFSHTLWEELQSHEVLSDIKNNLKDDLAEYYREMGGLTSFSFGARYGRESTESFVAE